MYKGGCRGGSPIWVKGLNKSLNTCRWADLSEQAKDLLLRMLEYDPTKRITSKQARTTSITGTQSLLLPACGMCGMLHLI